MSEAFERSAQRANQAARNEEAFESPTIRSIGDIQRVLQQLDPTDKLNIKLSPVKQDVQLLGKDQRGDQHQFQVSAQSETRTHRDILIEGFQILRKRLATQNEAEDKQPVLPLVVNGQEMKPPNVISTDGVVLYIDPLIERLLGGYRDGMYICWNFGDGWIYRYEIFQHRLTRIEHVETDRSAGLGPMAEN
jgi:hypothetical protein